MQASTVETSAPRSWTGSDSGWARRVSSALPFMTRALVKRPWLPTSEFVGTGDDDLPVTTRLEASDSLLHFQSVLGDVAARDVMREQLERAPGSENFEFLLAFHSFHEARNPLQRFSQLSRIVNNFVREGAERRVQLSETCRQQLLRAFDHWEQRGRLPLDVQPGALETAAAEVNLNIIAACQQPLMPGKPVMWSDVDVPLEDPFYSFD